MVRGATVAAKSRGSIANESWAFSASSQIKMSETEKVLVQVKVEYRSLSFRRFVSTAGFETVADEASVPIALDGSYASESKAFGHHML
jgi:hypothetical protein